MRSATPYPSKVDHAFDEPAYSLLVRTLQHNGSRRIGMSVDRLIGAREKATSRWDPAEIARVCKADYEAVRHATPDVNGKTAKVMGQTLSAEHVGIRVRRWCPACLRARPYHRVWWDVLPVTSCPEHGIKLTSSCGCEGRSLQWRSGTLLHCRAGHALEAVDCPEAEPGVLAFDAYVIGRLRGDDGERPREFDDVALGELIGICERLGKASFDEERTIHVVRKSHDIGRLHAEGFRILRGLPDTFDELLGRLRISKVWQKERCQFRRAYGSLYIYVRDMPGHSVGFALQSALADHVRRNLSARSSIRLNGRTPLVADRIVVSRAADELGMLHGRLMNLLDQLAIPLERRAGTFEMTVTDLEALKARLVGSLSLKQVGAALHLTTVEVAGLASGGLIDVIATGKGSGGWIFPATAGAELLVKLRARAGKPGPTPERFVSLPRAAQALGVSVAEALRPVLEGSVEVRARWSRRQGLAGFNVDQADLGRIFAGGDDAGVTLSVAAHRLGLTQNTMDAAIAASLLRTVTAEGVYRVKAEEIERFGTRWATMRELRQAMGVTRWVQVATLLNRAGVDSPLMHYPMRERVYPREDAMRACTAAASSRDEARDVGRDLQSLAGTLNLPPYMINQVIEAGLIATEEGCTSGRVSANEIERFRETYVTLPELGTTFGLSGPRAVLSVLDKAGVPATCRRTTFCAYLFPRGKAVEALHAWARLKEAVSPLSRLPTEAVLSMQDTALRLGTERNMIRQLISNKLLASTWQGRALGVPVSEIERFSRMYVFAIEVARLTGRTHAHGTGAAVTKVLLRNGVRPVCSRPHFVNYVFNRNEAIDAIEKLSLS